MREGGKAGLKSNNTLSAGGWQSLLGSQCGRAAIHRGILHHLARRQLGLGGDSVSESNRGRGRDADAPISRETKIAKGLIQSNRVRKIPAVGRVWREAASTGRTRAGRS